MKKTSIVLGIVLAFLVVLAVAIPFLFDANRFRPQLEAKLTQALGRAVKVDDLKISVLSGGIAASDLTIAEDPAFGNALFLRSRSLKIGVDLRVLVRERRLSVRSITLDEPDINLIRDSAGVWNFSSLRSASPQRRVPRAALAPLREAETFSSRLTVAKLTVSGGRVSIRRLGGKARPIMLDRVELHATNVSQSSAFPVTLSAYLPANGRLKLSGTAGPIDTEDTISTPFKAQLAMEHLDALASGLVDPSTAISGLFSLEATANSQHALVAIDGTLKAEQLKLDKGATPAKRPVNVDFSLAYDLGKLINTVRRADIHIGAATMTLTGLVRMGSEPATIDAKLAGSNMPATDLAALLPALDVVLPAGASVESGTVQLSTASQGPLDQLFTTGTLSLQNARLANFDLATKMKVVEALAGIKAEPHTTIQALNASFKNSPVGTTVDSLQVVVPSIGELTGTGTISPSHALDLRMRAKVNAAAGRLESIGFKNGIPFMIGGTSANPSFRPDVKGMATDQLKDVSSAPGAATGLIDSLIGRKKKK
jgi:AsmA protein